MDRPARPFPFRAQVAPGLDFLVAELARLGIDRVELRQAQAIDRIVLVDEDGSRRRLAERAHAARGHADGSRRIAELVDEGFGLRGEHLAGHGGEIALAGDEARRAGAPAAPIPRDAERAGLLPVELAPAD